MNLGGGRWKSIGVTIWKGADLSTSPVIFLCDSKHLPVHTRGEKVNIGFRYKHPPLWVVHFQRKGVLRVMYTDTTMRYR